MSRFVRNGVRLALIAMACVAGACETTTQTTDGRPMPPEPRAGTLTPSDAPINAIALLPGPKPLDTNGNQKPDTIQVQAFLFARPYPMPTWREGTFEFSIYPSGQIASPQNPGVKPIRSWTIPDNDLQSVRTKLFVGDGYALSLSLLDNGGTDSIDAQSVDLVARFVPVEGGGQPISSLGVRTLSMQSSSAAAQPGR